MLELALTRIFSVVLWYHFAFMIVSVALMGLAAGGLVVYLRFSREEINLPSFALKFTALSAFSILGVMFFLLNLRGIPTISAAGFLLMMLVYSLVAIPFFLNGMVIAAIIASYPLNVSKLYFADLLGAGIGCMVLIPILNQFGGVNTIYFICLVLLVASFAFASGISAKKALLPAGFFAFMFILMLGNDAIGLLKIRYLKGESEATNFGTPLIQKWNSFSRIAVYPWTSGLSSTNRDSPRLDISKGVERDRFITWALSERYSGYLPAQLAMNIDGAANTMINRFSGDIHEMEYALYEVTAFGYYLTTEPFVLIIGPGGGPDVLAALRFNASKITCVELNPIIYELVNEVYGDFSGHLYSHPKINAMVAEGRNFLERTSDTYDFIHISLVDTWAATAAGAYTLSENTLYTSEAFSSYWERLTDNGILSISRYVFDPPRQTLRLLSLALSLLEQKGIRNPQDHLVIFQHEQIGTFLLCKSPFSKQQVTFMRQRAGELGFKVRLLPDTRLANEFNDLLYSKNRQRFYAAYPFDITPCSDDKPFFFNMLRPKDFLGVLFKSPGGQQFNYDAVFTLMAVLVISFIYAILLATLPFTLSNGSDSGVISGQLRLMLYYAGIGLGFIFVEIYLLQKLILLLGHPVYSLSVVLFSMLISSGLGSRVTSSVTPGKAACLVKIPLLIIVLLLILYTCLIPFIQEAFIGSPLCLRIAICLVIISMVGFFMGMPFPLGIKIASQGNSSMIPYLWAINGAFSVFGSVAAFALAMSFGFSSVLYLSIVIYLTAMLISLALSPSKTAVDGIN